MKIGRIAYLNVFPFFNGLDARRWGPWIEGTPRELGERARRGEVDAAPLPVVDTFALEADFEPLGDLGIASRGAVQSVLFFSRQPFDRLTGARVLLTGDSVTSVELTRMLLEDAGNREIEFSRGDDPASHDGYLVIGDRALRMDQEAPFEHRTDLGEAWFQHTGLPFVFARWVVRRSVPAAEKEALAAALTASVARPLPVHIPNGAGLNPEQARAYLRGVIYRLDADCMAGLERFRERLHVHA